MKSLTLDLMRHGEPRQRGLYLGRTDLALSAAGQREAAKALAKSPGWQRIYSSPLQRCRDSAEHAASQLGIELRLDERLQEYDFGDWDGEPVTAVYQREPAAVAAFWDDPLAAPPPGAESIEAFQRRIKRSLTCCLDELGDEPRHYLWLCHGGVIRALIADCLGVTAANWQKITVDYCSLSRIRFFSDDEQYWSQLEYVNLQLF